MKVLVTGASGFVGREVCCALRAADIAFVPAGRRLGCIHGEETQYLDLASGLIPPELLHGVDAVIHLAGIAHQRAPSSSYSRVNYEATVALAQAALASGVRRFVYVSSVKAMGPASGTCARSEADCVPAEDDYGRSKWQAEQALREQFADADMSIAIVRPALVYGPQAAGNLALLQSLVRWRFPAPPALGGRSMVSVTDLARLLLALVHHNSDGVATWIAADGEIYSTRRLYLALRAAQGLGDSPVTLPLWCWQLLSRLYDLTRSGGGQSSFDKLFGTELYRGEAVQTAVDWRAEQRFEDVL